MHPRIVIALAVVVAVGAAVVVPTAFTASGTASKSAAAKVGTRHTKLGTILVDAKGQTLYLFEKDRHGRSACAGACARNWPPSVTRGRPKVAGHGVRARLLGTTRRSDGTTQVTYGGHPLYTFVGDRGRPGSTTGQGLNAFGAEWYVVGPNGRKVEHKGS